MRHYSEQSVAQEIPFQETQHHNFKLYGAVEGQGERQLNAINTRIFIIVECSKFMCKKTSEFYFHDLHVASSSEASSLTEIGLVKCSKGQVTSGSQK